MPVTTKDDIDNYDKSRGQIQTGDILICSGSAFFSDLIKKATGSPWSHVGLIFRLNDIGRVMVLESVESMGVRAVPLRHYVSNYRGQGEPYPGRVYVARHAEMTPPDQEKVLVLAQQAADLLGQPYDNEEIARIAARIASGGRFGKKDPERNRAYICSEYVDECLAKIDIHIKRDELGFVAPSDFGADENVNTVFRLL